MKTVLITAYAVNPFKGSEDGTGWNISREIAKTNRVILITRKNNIPHIKKYVEEGQDSIMKNIEFYGFDLPVWFMRLKKKMGERGYVLYFYFWQLFIIFFIRKNKLRFDIAHCLNFHSDSHPHFLWFFGKPTFWGPIGHHPKVPKAYLLKVYGWKSYIRDRMYYCVKWLMRNLDPFYRVAVNKTETIFAINSSVESVVPGSKGKVVILPAVASEQVINNYYKKVSDDFTVLSVGRFHYMKGFDITIRAFAHFYHQLDSKEKKKVKLVLVGKGAEKQRLKAIAQACKIDSKINWIRWVERSEMHQIYAQSDVFLFPSHEGAGMVVTEAMSYGLPVLSFNNEGPGELVSQSSPLVEYNDYERSIVEFSHQLKRLYYDEKLQIKYGISNQIRSNTLFTWEYKGKVITRLYHKLGILPINTGL